MSTSGWESVTEADAKRMGRLAPQRYASAEKKSKYRNERVVVDGQQFDSKKEATHWLFLKAQASAGEIFGLERQRAFSIYLPDMTKPGPYEALSELCEYRSDFTFRDELDTLHVQDVKSKATRTAVYMLKKRAMWLQYGIEIEEV